MQGHHYAIPRRQTVGEHGRIRLVEHLERAPAEFAHVAVVPDERAHELQERVGVAFLLRDIHMLGSEPAFGDRDSQARRARRREAAVAAGAPLHRRAHRHPAADVEVLAHPDLLAVEEHGGAGQGEEQAVDHPDAPRVAVEHRRQPADQAAAVHLHPLLRAEGVEHLVALLRRQLVEGELVMVAHEVGPLDVGRAFGRESSAVGQWARIPSRQREVQVLHADEVELHRQLVALGAAEELVLLVARQVDLAEQDALTGPPVQERPQRAQVGVRVGKAPRPVDDAVGLQQERHGVDPEARDAELQPEPDDLGDLVAHPLVGDVEVGLLTVEDVQVVLPGLLVVLPVAGLLVGEDRRRLVLRRLVAPDVEVAVRRVAGSSAPP